MLRVVLFPFEVLRLLAEKPSVRRDLVLATIAISILGLASSLYSIQVLSRYLTMGVDATLVTLTLGAILAVIFEYVLRRVRLRVAQDVARERDTRLGQEVLDGLGRSRYADYESIPVARRRDAFLGLATIQQGHSGNQICTVLDAPSAIVFIIVLAMISPTLAILTVSIISFLMLLAASG